MTIMVFLHGATIMQRNGLGRTRRERVQQVLDREESVADFASYVPIGNAAEKLSAWRRQGAYIVYFTFHKKADEVEMDRSIIQKHGFPDGPVLFRQEGQQYKDLVEQVVPEVLIEDDCESIGGQAQMASAHLSPEARNKIEAIAVREFEGIDHLPDDLTSLKGF